MFLCIIFKQFPHTISSSLVLCYLFLLNSDVELDVFYFFYISLAIFILSDVNFCISPKSTLNVVLQCIVCVDNLWNTAGYIPLRQQFYVAHTFPSSCLWNVNEIWYGYNSSGLESSTLTHLLFTNLFESFIIQGHYFVWQLLSLSTLRVTAGCSEIAAVPTLPVSRLTRFGSL